MKNCVFYPGSFDPVTNGHVDIIARALALFDRVVVGVGVHHGKVPMFSDDERVELIKAATSELGQKFDREIAIVTFDDLAVDAAKREGALAIVRGLRDSGDFRYEMQMAGMNSGMARDLETLFFAASPGVRHIASNFVRQIASLGGDVSPFVPNVVTEKLRAKFER